MERRVSRGIGACALGVVIVAASGVARADEQAGLRPQNNTFSVGALLGVFMPDAQHEFYDTDESFMPLNEAGVELGISKSWASRLHAQAVDRLRTLVDAESS